MYLIPVVVVDPSVSFCLVAMEQVTPGLVVGLKLLLLKLQSLAED